MECVTGSKNGCVITIKTFISKKIRANNLLKLMSRDCDDRGPVTMTEVQLRQANLCLYNEVKDGNLLPNAITICGNFKPEDYI